MRGFLLFWGRAITHAFAGGWLVFGVVTTAMPDMVAVVLKFSPNEGEATWLNAHPVRSHLIAVAIAIAVYFIYAPYKLWRERHERGTTYEDSLKRQLTEMEGENRRLILELEEERKKYAGPDIWGKCEKWMTAFRENDVIVFSLISIYNKASPTVLDGWRLRLKSSKKDVTENASIWAGRLPFTNEFMPREDWLYDRCMKPIDKGQCVRGWVCHILPVNIEDTRESESEYSLMVCDAWGKEHEIRWKSKGGKHWENDHPYLPGVDNPFASVSSRPSEWIDKPQSTIDIMRQGFAPTPPSPNPDKEGPPSTQAS